MSQTIAAIERMMTPTWFLAAGKYSDLIAALTIGGIILVLGGVVLVLWLVSEGRGILFRRKIQRFLGKPLAQVTTVQTEFQSLDLPNLHRAIGVWSRTVQIDTKQLPEPEVDLAEYPVLVLGERVGVQSFEFLDNLEKGKAKPQKVRYQLMRVALRTRVRVPTGAVYLLTYDGHPVILWDEPNGGLHAAGLTEDVLERFLEHLIQLIRACSFYRGQVVSVSQEQQDYRTNLALQFHDIPNVTEAEIVLPDATLQLLKRSTVEYFRVAKQLVALGQSGSRGLLMHGPPGTGKTLVTRWLLSQMKDVTKFLLSGMQLVQLKETVQLARMLSPSVLVLDDVDLIATRREENAYGVALHDLMNIMDGVDPSDQVMFLLTTNRPEVIESAILNRPGRIDQAIQFPLPDEECRHRLIELFCQGTDLSQITMSRWVDETDQSSPAFLRELVRRAMQNALVRDGTECKLTDGDFRIGLADMVTGSGLLTKQLLGFKTV